MKKPSFTKELVFRVFLMLIWITLFLLSGIDSITNIESDTLITGLVLLGIYIVHRTYTFNNRYVKYQKRNGK